MTETERIAEELRLLFEGPSWLGPAIYSLIADVSQETAAHKPLAHAHSIWELVLHIEAWLRVARLRLDASSPLDPSDEENWPATKGSWGQVASSLRNEVSALHQAISDFSPDRLEDVAPAQEPQTFYVLLHGVVQHSAYHAGQIAILKRAGV